MNKRSTINCLRQMGLPQGGYSVCLFIYLKRVPTSFAAFVMSFVTQKSNDVTKWCQICAFLYTNFTSRTTRLRYMSEHIRGLIGESPIKVYCTHSEKMTVSIVSCVGIVFITTRHESSQSEKIRAK